jgi:hypothetical protein
MLLLLPVERQSRTKQSGRNEQHLYLLPAENNYDQHTKISDLET